MQPSQVDRQRLIDRMFNPQVLFIGLHEAAAILGIAKSTARKAVDESGELCPGVPVNQIGHRRRYVVSTAHLRAKYGADRPSVGVSHDNTFSP